MENSCFVMVGLKMESSCFLMVGSIPINLPFKKNLSEALVTSADVRSQGSTEAPVRSQGEELLRMRSSRQMSNPGIAQGDELRRRRLCSRSGSGASPRKLLPQTLNQSIAECYKKGDVLRKRRVNSRSSPMQKSNPGIAERLGHSRREGNDHERRREGDIRREEERKRDEEIRRRREERKREEERRREEDRRKRRGEKRREEKRREEEIRREDLSLFITRLFLIVSLVILPSVALSLIPSHIEGESCKLCRSVDRYVKKHPWHTLLLPVIYSSLMWVCWVIGPLPEPARVRWFVKVCYTLLCSCVSQSPHLVDGPSLAIVSAFVLALIPMLKLLLVLHDLGGFDAFLSMGSAAIFKYFLSKNRIGEAWVYASIYAGAVLGLASFMDKYQLSVRSLVDRWYGPITE